MQVTITASGLVRGRINERSAFTATANFFSDAWVATAPTNAYYRIDRVNDDPSCAQELLAWTSLSPAASISIPVTAAQNAIQDDYSRCERRQITVKGDHGLAGQYQKTLRYEVHNLAGQSS